MIRFSDIERSPLCPLQARLCRCLLLTLWRGRPTMDGNTARGASSPAKPALHIPEPLSTTRAWTSPEHTERSRSRAESESESGCFVPIDRRFVPRLRRCWSHLRCIRLHPNRALHASVESGWSSCVERILSSTLLLGWQRWLLLSPSARFPRCAGWCVVVCRRTAVRHDWRVGGGGGRGGCDLDEIVRTADPSSEQIWPTQPSRADMTPSVPHYHHEKTEQHNQKHKQIFMLAIPLICIMARALAFSFLRMFRAHSDDPLAR